MSGYGSTIKLARPAPLIPLLSLVFLVLCTSVRADVYSQKPITASQLSGLSALLPRSLRPGGTRNLTINGSGMAVTRHIVESPDELSRAITHD